MKCKVQGLHSANQTNTTNEKKKKWSQPSRWTLGCRRLQRGRRTQGVKCQTRRGSKIHRRPSPSCAPRRWNQAQPMLHDSTSQTPPVHFTHCYVDEKKRGRRSYHWTTVTSCICPLALDRSGREIHQSITSFFCRVVTAAMFWMRSFSMMIFAHRSGYKSCLFIFLILPEPKLFLLKIVVTSSTCRMDWEIKKISQSHLAKLWQG